MALPDEAIARIRFLIQTGELEPGARLPPEPQLAAQLGISRNSMREAVRALQAARVLDVRRGDGTYVTSLAPQLLLEGLGFAVELLQDQNLLDVMEIRRMLEPVATGAAASRISSAVLSELESILVRMEAVQHDSEQLVAQDSAFHRAVVGANGNEALTSLLDGLSSKTMRARVWRGLLEGNAAARTLAEHREIYEALVAGDAALAQAAALVHIHTSEAWLRSAIRNAAT